MEHKLFYQIDLIKLTNQKSVGGIYFMPAPKSDSLYGHMALLKQAGVTDVVSLITGSEVEELQLQSEKAICRSNQIDFHNHPIADYGLPENEREFIDFARALNQRIDKGGKIAIHCRGGVGRSSLLIAVMLMLMNVSLDKALAHISQVRSKYVPETPGQLEWLKRLDLQPDDGIQNL